MSEVGVVSEEGRGAGWGEAAEPGAVGVRDWVLDGAGEIVGELAVLADTGDINEDVGAEAGLRGGAWVGVRLGVGLGFEPVVGEGDPESDASPVFVTDAAKAPEEEEGV